MPVSQELIQKAARIKLLLLDVDGVLTDGRVYFGEKGEQFRAFHFRDIMGIARLQRAGVKVGFLTGEAAGSTRALARKLTIGELHEEIRDKLTVVDMLVQKYGLAYEEVAYIGDDINDVPVLKKVGLGVAVADAMPAAKRAAQYVTESGGGRGAAREICDLIRLTREGEEAVG